MRQAGMLVVAMLAVGAMAAGTDATDRLFLLSLSARGTTTRLRTAFASPVVAAAQDVRDDVIGVRIGDEGTTLFDPESASMKFSKDGRRARYRAPKRSGARIRKFRLSTAAGSFSAVLDGAPLDSRRPPVISLSFAGTTYVFDPATEVPAQPDDPIPPGTTTLPDGPLAFSDVARMPAEVTPTVVNAVLRSSMEIYQFTSRFSFGGGVPAAFSQVDFSKEMVVVAVGDNTGYGILPWSVRIGGVQAQGGRVIVSYDKYWGPICCSRSLDDPLGGPPYAAYFHAVKVPMTSAPVDFVATSVKTQTPWD